MTKFYEHRHVVTFQETNVVGNVYYVNHIAWQGVCREMFLREHAPGIVRRLGPDLALVTVSCRCDYLGELFAFDEVLIKMRLVEALQNRIDLQFDMYRGDELVAVGNQRIACMQQRAGRLAPVEIPGELRAALRRFE